MSEQERSEMEMEHAELFYVWGFLESLRDRKSNDYQQHIANIVDHIERKLPSVQRAKQREADRKAKAEVR